MENMLTLTPVLTGQPEWTEQLLPTPVGGLNSNPILSVTLALTLSRT